MSYKICKRCVMDSSDPDLSLDAQGVCFYCRSWRPIKAQINSQRSHSSKHIHKMADEIKRRSKNEYDCVLGISGGVDSSYLAYFIKEKMGLNPLAVHFDNGWNSDIAVKNIKKLLDKLDIDLYTYVVDWQEFRDLQRAFILSSVVDIELLTDNAIYATLLRVAKQHNISSIVSGANKSTEFGMPISWTWCKFDAKNIKSIHKRFGQRSLKTFPSYSVWQFVYHRLFKSFKFFMPLDYIEYIKKDAVDFLQKEFDWEDYGGKHYESKFTQFYQAYILPTKFNIDKRRVHYSGLIRNAELTREEALEKLKLPLYSPEKLTIDKAYILKKLGFSEKEFDKIMCAPIKYHKDYASQQWLLNMAVSINGKLSKFRK